MTDKLLNNTAEVQIHHADDPQILAEQLGQRIISVLAEALKQRDKAYLVVSGGSTPKPLFEYLSTQIIDWSKIVITLADERCVEPQDPISNSYLIKQHLLINEAASAQFISLYEGGSPQIEDQVTAGLKLLALPQYDIVILGMGDDGHTASIFPEASNRSLAQNCQSRAALLTDPVTVKPLRITQTVSRLLNTRHLALHFTGNQKAHLFKTITKTPDPSAWPVSSFITQACVPIEVFCDQLIQEDIGS